MAEEFFGELSRELLIEQDAHVWSVPRGLLRAQRRPARAKPKGTRRGIRRDHALSRDSQSGYGGARAFRRKPGSRLESPDRYGQRAFDLSSRAPPGTSVALWSPSTGSA